MSGQQVGDAAVEAGYAPLPEEQCGYYVGRLGDGRLMFGRPKNRVVCWEVVELVDLLDLGIKPDDIKAIPAGGTYRARPAMILLEPW